MLTEPSGEFQKAHIICVAKAGHVNQCIAVCEAQGWQVEKKTLVPGFSRMDSPLRKLIISMKRSLMKRWLSPRRREPERLVIVAGGFSGEALVAAYRKLYGSDLFAVFVGSPKRKQPIFDIAIASHHALGEDETRTEDLYAGSRQTVWMAGVPVRKSGLKPVPALQQNFAGVFIGGLNKAYDVDGGLISAQLLSLMSAPQWRGLAPSIVFSRRTPAEVENSIRQAMRNTEATFVDRGDRQGFERTLAGASRFAVTPDSISMICEACETGKPVTVFDLPCFNQETSTARLVREFARLGYVSLDANASAPEQPVHRRQIPAMEAVRRSHAKWLLT